MIESSQNKKIKLVSNLLSTKKFRDNEGLFVVESKKTIEDYHERMDIEFILKSEEVELNFEDERIIEVKDNVIKKLSETVTTQGVIAVCKKKECTIDNMLDSDNKFIVILEEIQDPGNLGTIIRTADAAGASGVIISKGSVDLYNPKVVRSTMGSLFNISTIDGVNLESVINKLKNKDVKVLGAHLRTDKMAYDLELKNNIAFVIGNEGNGLSDEVTELCDMKVKLPIIGDSESLNAAMASGILLYEVVRQRLYS
ncbi:MAG: RNA methyltransferase [Clostridia bacterium]|jgi:TrmH family RNA methyltransferase|nr:RNA methyltransferase [Clostridia bacterium]